MAIKLGSNDIANLYYGTKSVSSVYRGEEEIWTNMRVLSLGRGTSFNVGTLYPNLDLTKLTVDDFFFNNFSAYSSSTASCRSWDSSGSRESSHCLSPGSASCSISMNKSYDSSTGICTMNYGGNACDGYLILNSAKLITKGKLISLGSGTSFDVTSTISEYASLTSKNFMFRTISSATDSMNWCYSTGCPVSVSWANSYSNGTLTAYVSRMRLGSVAVTPYYVAPRYMPSSDD